MRSVLAFAIMAAITLTLAVIVGTRVAAGDTRLFREINIGTDPVWRTLK